MGSALAIKRTRIGAHKNGGLSKYLLMLAKALLHASSHSKRTSFFINLLKGWHQPTRFEMNCHIYASFPCKLLSSRRFLGSGIFWIALIWIGQSRYHNALQQI